MGRCCGKCSFEDNCDIFGIDYMLNSKIYHNDELLDIKEERDLVPWYPYIIAMSFGDKDGAVIHLSSVDYIARHETEMLTIYLERLKKIYRRCKRKHEEFNIEEVYRREFCYFYEQPELLPLVEKVAEQGNKATIDGVYMKMAEFYRNEWRRILIEYGYDAEWIEEWIYKGRKH